MQQDPYKRESNNEYQLILGNHNVISTIILYLKITILIVIFYLRIHVNN